MNIPMLSAKTFTFAQQHLLKKITKTAWRVMAAAVVEEKSHTIANGNGNEFQRKVDEFRKTNTEQL